MARSPDGPIHGWLSGAMQRAEDPQYIRRLSLGGAAFGEKMLKK
jgi:hypothetical protein